MNYALSIFICMPTIQQACQITQLSGKLLIIVIIGSVCLLYTCTHSQHMHIGNTAKNAKQNEFS